MSRIAIISPFPPPPDGIGTHTEHLAHAWRDAGHEVLVVAAGQATANDAAHGFAVKRCLRPFGANAAATAIIAFQPDLAFCQFAVSALTSTVAAALMACRSLVRSGIPVAMSFHEPVREIERLGPAGRPIYAAALSSCTQPFTFSSGATESLAWSARSADIVQIPHGVPLVTAPSAADRARVRTAYDLHGTYVLDFGFIHPDKGVDVLVAAACLEAFDGHESIDVVIAGRPRVRTSIFKIFGRVDQRHYDELRASAGSVPAHVRMRFLDYLPADDLVPLLAEAGVVVLPYRHTTQSGVASYVLAAGAASVVTDLPGLRGAFGDAASYATPGDPLQLALAINEVISSPALRQTLQTNALARAASEGYDVVAEEIRRVTLRRTSSPEEGPDAHGD
jgi:glycosyltransferase involved in cell wall biosynthesis